MNEEKEKLEKLKSILFDALKQIRKKIQIISTYNSTIRLNISTHGEFLLKILLTIKDVR